MFEGDEFAQRLILSLQVQKSVDQVQFPKTILRIAKGYFPVVFMPFGF
jgi:hypothetical protein